MDLSSQSMNDALNTPMLRQYLEIKAGVPDAILFFRLGDFYEMFLDDAKVAARELELTLTGRGKEGNRVPMCGIPHHASESYIQKLVGRGYKVAICEQTEDASHSKGITKRDVVQIITPGTVISSSGLRENECNYLVAFAQLKKGYSISFLELSTGEFKVARVVDRVHLDIQIARLASREVVIPTALDFTLPDGVVVNRSDFLNPDRAASMIAGHFKLSSVDAWGVGDWLDCLPAAWAILEYAKYAQKNAMPQIVSLQPHRFDDGMMMDRTTMHNLELVQGRDSVTKQTTLYSLLNYTRTAMGGRKLKQVVQEPICNVRRIDARLDAVEDLVNDVVTREEIRTALTDVYDIERLTARIAAGTHNPRDCIALKESLGALSGLGDLLDRFKSRFFRRQAQYFSGIRHETSPISTIVRLIATAIVEAPPVSSRDGGVIQDGYSPELVQLKASFAEVRDWVGGLEEIERESTGIKSLKVGFNKVFGYYIELPNSQKDKAPLHYIRKQTLANAERYITPDLKEKEIVLLNGEERQNALEFELFQTIVQEISAYTGALQECAGYLAELDCIQSIATASQRNGYVRPQFVESGVGVLEIRNGRHPIVEQNMGAAFVSNTVEMAGDNARFILLTGPNMAGKSTLMRQVALSVVMAQIGCFVPAETFRLSPVDCLYTRIGALDNLYLGQSTFMVEMLETAAILANATPNSLIILDEIGRGTSTFDGMSLACAISEYIHTQINARTLFATHYHELTVLEQAYSGIINYTMEISEIDGQLVFTHRFIRGTADKSYGIHVAKMAGIPDVVIEQAQALLDGFEREGVEFLKKKVM